jgi:hypothetical protein
MTITICLSEAKSTNQFLSHEFFLFLGRGEKKEVRYCQVNPSFSMQHSASEFTAVILYFKFKVKINYFVYRTEFCVTKQIGVTPIAHNIYPLSQKRHFQIVEIILFIEPIFAFQKKIGVTPFFCLLLFEGTFTSFLKEKES